MEPPFMSSADQYKDGSYLAKTGGTWHVEDAPFKAQWVRLILDRNHCHPLTICEIGCGAGAILSELQRGMPDASFTGYEISPQAHALSHRYTNDRCRFVLGDSFADDAVYDLALCMDVIEHVEDCFGFMRRVKAKAARTIYHIPLDAYALAIVHGHNAWDDVGHIHLFTLETALRSVERAGYRIIDWSLTDASLGAPVKDKRTLLMNLARKPLSLISERLTARLLGGYSLIVLAE